MCCAEGGAHCGEYGGFGDYGCRVGPAGEGEGEEFVAGAGGGEAGAVLGWVVCKGREFWEFFWVSMDGMSV